MIKTSKLSLVCLLTTITLAPSTTLELSTVSQSSSETLSPLRKVIDKLNGLNYNVQSGNISIIGNDSFCIPNFYFDGTAPFSFFWVGKGNKVSENGTLVPVIENITEPLGSYNNQTIILKLPNNLTVNDIDWLAVWSKELKQNLGYVFVRKKTYPPQTFNLNNIVTSNSIVLVNKKTLFVPNFHYKGDHKNVHFWVGNGSQPSSDGVAIPDEKGSEDSLSTYAGQNLNLSLPDDISTDNIDYFAVWSIDEELSLGSVPIKGITGVPDAPKTRKIDVINSNNFTMILPKCCPHNSVLTIEGCIEDTVPYFQPKFNIYEHNQTHFCNESLDLSKINFEANISQPQCERKYPLDENLEEFALLQNTSLLLKGKGTKGIIGTDQFCLDYVQDENKTLEMKILVCYIENNLQPALYAAYVVLIIVSIVCFLVTFVLHIFLLIGQQKNNKSTVVHRQLFSAYLVCMAVSFIMIVIVQTSYVGSGGCQVLGFIFQLSVTASFILLAVLCYDVLFITKYLESKQMHLRWCLGMSVGIPIFFVIISLCRNLTPDVPDSFFKPQFEKNTCFFEADDQRTIFFYIPIGLSIIVSLICLGWTKYLIIQNDSDKIYDYFWSENEKICKFMWLKYFIILIMTIIWSVDTLIFSILGSVLSGIEIIEASQGIFILLLLVTNKKTRSDLINVYKRQTLKRRPKTNHNKEEDTVLETIT